MAHRGRYAVILVRVPCRHLQAQSRPLVAANLRSSTPQVLTMAEGDDIVMRRQRVIGHEGFAVHRAIAAGESVLDT